MHSSGLDGGAGICHEGRQDDAPFASKAIGELAGKQSANDGPNIDDGDIQTNQIRREVEVLPCQQSLLAPVVSTLDLHSVYWSRALTEFIMLWS